MDGLDFAWAPRPSVAAILAGRYRFVCRYLSWDTMGKNLTYDEARGYLNNHIAVVSNWEYNPQAASHGYGQGVSDAREAARQHAACGGPDSAPIYFSVDWNVPTNLFGTVADYFRGVASVIGLARTGAYGGYPIIKYLFDIGAVTYGWQTYAWSSGRWDSRAQLRQVLNGITVGGADCDRDVSTVDDFGQWVFKVDAATITIREGTMLGWLAVDETDPNNPQYYLCNGIESVPKTLQGATDLAYLDHWASDARKFLVTGQDFGWNDKTWQDLPIGGGAIAAQAVRRAWTAAAMGAVRTGGIDAQALADALAPHLPAELTTEQVTAAARTALAGLTATTTIQSGV